LHSANNFSPAPVSTGLNVSSLIPASQPGCRQTLKAKDTKNYLKHQNNADMLSSTFRFIFTDTDPAFFLIADPGSRFRIRIPYQDPGFDDIKLEKIYSWKFHFCFLTKGRQSYRIRIRNLNADPDTATQINADPCGSGYGSETLLSTVGISRDRTSGPRNSLLVKDVKYKYNQSVLEF
jgi:hypothetical protein